MKSLILFLLFPLCCWAQSDWVVQQIKSDLQEESISRKALRAYFSHLSESGGRGLYCKIYQNRIQWIATKTLPAYKRRTFVMKYFESIRHFGLPDVEFILQTGDGAIPAPITTFAFAKSDDLPNVCLIPDHEAFMEALIPSKNVIQFCHHLSLEHPWNKKLAVGYFRGSPTGPINLNREDLGNVRVRAALFSFRHPDLLDAKLCHGRREGVGTLFQKLGIPFERAPISDHFKFRYLLDIDGHSCSYARCRWILLSNSTLLKPNSVKSQWYYKALDPWVHFVPIADDFSDFKEIINKLREDDALAQKIARKGQELGEKIFTKEALDHYMLALLHAYATRLKE